MGPKAKKTEFERAPEGEGGEKETKGPENVSKSMAKVVGYVNWKH